jgi:hypothetical protein
MSQHRVNLHLSRSDSFGSSSSYLERTSSLVESNFEANSEIYSPDRVQESQINLQRVKNLLTSASERIKATQLPQTEILIQQKLLEKTKEAAYLKELVKKLENEK